MFLAPFFFSFLTVMVILFARGEAPLPFTSTRFPSWKPLAYLPGVISFGPFSTASLCVAPVERKAGGKQFFYVSISFAFLGIRVE